MQFTHETTIVVESAAPDVWGHWADAACLPRHLSHLRGAVQTEEADDLARLMISLEGRHLEFAVQRTMCEQNTVCWQSLVPLFFYVLTVAVTPLRGCRAEITVTIAYDPPGFLPDIAETCGLSKRFQKSLEADMRRYAEMLRQGAIELAFAN